MALTRHDQSLPIERVEAAAYTVPTDQPESDGTLRWDQTTIIVVTVSAGHTEGVGYSYGHAAITHLINSLLADVLDGYDAMAVPACWEAMVRAIRNLGRPGIASMAIAAVDTALWDLKAKLLEAPLITVLGPVRDAVPIYGSGGFTSYTTDELWTQLNRWVESGIPRVKMKVGRHPDHDVARVQAARAAIGPDAELFVDANGAYGRKQALALAERFAEYGVTWFEEPVSSDDLEGLRFVRDRTPRGMDVTAGEYGYDRFYFRRMLEAGAVDVLQVDATRCAGISGFLRAAVVSEAHSIPLSAHTAPLIHLHPCCALGQVRHIEYFHDHVRIERMLFDGVPEPVNGTLAPDLSRPGLGVVFKQADAEHYAVA